MPYYVYILTSTSKKPLYTGVTNDLKRRLYEHVNGLIPGYTKRYNVHHLVYFEETDYLESALAREKQIKNYSRAKKESLVERENPDWDSLNDKVLTS